MWTSVQPTASDADPSAPTLLTIVSITDDLGPRYIGEYTIADVPTVLAEIGDTLSNWVNTPRIVHIWEHTIGNKGNAGKRYLIYYENVANKNNPSGFVLASTSGARWGKTLSLVSSPDVREYTGSWESASINSTVFDVQFN